MLRDDNIEIIKSKLDSIVNDDDKKAQYEAIVALANHTMNLEVLIDEHGKHQVYWNNRKLGSGSFDTDLENLVEYINQIQD